MTRVTSVQAVGQKLDDVRRFEVDAEASVAIGDASPGIRKMKHVLNKSFMVSFYWEIVIRILDFLSSKLFSDP